MYIFLWLAPRFNCQGEYRVRAGLNKNFLSSKIGLFKECLRCFLSRKNNLLKTYKMAGKSNPNRAHGVLTSVASKRNTSCNTGCIKKN